MIRNRTIPLVVALLVFGYVVSWLFDRIFGQITSFDPGTGEESTDVSLMRNSAFALCADLLSDMPVAGSAERQEASPVDRPAPVRARRRAR